MDIMKNKLLPRSTMNSKLLYFKRGGIVKFQHSGKLPIGTQAQYDHVTGIYQSLVDKGINPQAALDLVNQKVFEGGWKGYSTGDGKRYKDVDSFTNHLIDWHRRMYPESLKANNFEEYYKGIMVTPKHKYNPRGNAYRKDLERTRPGVKKRINYYRSLQNLPPLVQTDQVQNVEDPLQVSYT